MKPDKDLHNLEIRVESFDPLKRVYPVTVELNDGRIFKGRLRLDNIQPPPTSGDTEAIKTYGLMLFNRLFHDSLIGAFQQAWSAAMQNECRLRIRLWLDSEDEQINAIPWELLHYDVSGGASPPLPAATDSQIAFSRYLDSTEPEGKPFSHRPVRMLVVISDPNDLGPGKAWPHLIPVGKADYKHDLESRFQPLLAFGQVEYHFLEPASAEQLHIELQTGYDIILYFGHGLRHPRRGTRLLLEDHFTGEGRLYEGETLVNRLKQLHHRPGLIVLVACDTAAQFANPTASEQPASQPRSDTPQPQPETLQPTTSLAAQLVKHGGIPAVLAMQRLVDISLARIFSFHLSDQLLQHGIIDVAVNAARQRVFNLNRVDWSTPVLYMRSNTGRLFSPNPRLEYALALLANHTFARWKSSEFIQLEAIIVPPGEDWAMVHNRPEDAPSSQNALTALKQTIPEQDTSVSKQHSPISHYAPAPLNRAHNLVAVIASQRSGQTVLLRRLAFDLADEACHTSSSTSQPEGTEPQQEPPPPPPPPAGEGTTPASPPDPSDVPLVEIAQHIVTQYGKDDFLSGAESFLGKPIAVFVPLKGYENQRVSTSRLEHLIIEVVNKTEPLLGTELSNLFQQARTETAEPADATRTTNYVFLFDGLDTIPEEQRVEAAQEIVHLANCLPNQHFILSCNQNVFPTSLFRHISVLVIQPINERTVQQYLRQRNPERSMELFRSIVANGLLGLTTDPALLSLIYERITRKGGETLTRAQLVQDFVDNLLLEIPSRYTQGNAARTTFTSLAWEIRWNHKEVLSVHEVFSIMDTVRHDRDYSLENLYQLFLRNNLLLNIGPHMVRFPHPLLASYGASMALIERSDWVDRFYDILVMCSVPQRQTWWEETIYGFVGMITSPAWTEQLFRVFARAVRNWAGPHTLLAVRCLASLPNDIRSRLSPHLQQELLDASITHINDTNASSPERRAKIIAALANLNYPPYEAEVCLPTTATATATATNDQQHTSLIDATLIRLLTERVNISPSGETFYEHTEVRIAAARALLTRYSVSIDQGTYVPFNLHRTDSPCSYIYRLLHAWKNRMRDELRTTLSSDSSTGPQRAIAAFALGDLAYHHTDEDVQLLFDIITRPDDGSLPDEWKDTIWTAADALILFDSDQVSRQLTTLITTRAEDITSDATIRQLIYIAGRVRTQDRPVIVWLLTQFLHHPNHKIKARALVSLSWLGDSLQSFEWLPESLQSLGFRLRSEPPRHVVKRAVQNIAAWDTDYLKEQNMVDPEHLDQGEDTRYLRRKAIESLAWIGDDETIDMLRPQVHAWDLPLRQAWYTTAAAIDSRLNGATS
jgi:hypothetical protein